LTAAGDRGLDRARNFRSLVHDLLSDFATMDLDMARKIKGDANAITLHGGYANDTDRVPRIADHDLFAFPAGDYKHRGTSCSPERRLFLLSAIYHIEDRVESFVFKLPDDPSIDTHGVRTRNFRRLILRAGKYAMMAQVSANKVQ
jgi:hypothetical protein